MSFHIGTAGRIDREKAKELFQQAGETGDPLAKLWLARCYDRMRCGFPKDENKARELATEALPEVRKLAQDGDAHAMTLLGSALLDGLGVTQDREEARNWLKKAAEAGDVYAMYLLASSLSRTLEHRGSAVKWFQRGAELGSISAMVELGRGHYFLESMLPLRRDPNEALRYFRRAAQAEDPDGMYYMGLVYQDGEAVEQNYVEAVQWYRKGVALGQDGCMTNLGKCYEEGWGVQQDGKQAAALYRQSAEMGNMYSMFNMGWVFYKGIGVTKNLNQAEEWTRKSAEAGYDRADGLLEAIAAERNGH